MELNSIILLAVLLIALIMAIFFMVKGFSFSGPLHSILMLLLFIQAVTFLYFAGAVQSTRVSEIKRFAQAQKQAESLVDSIEAVKYGDLTAPTNELTNLIPLAAELGRISAERGRVWRNSRFNGFANGVATIAIGQPAPGAPQIPGVAPEPAAAPAPAATNTDMTPEMVVYVFGESTVNNMPVPVFYMGEFFVTEVQAGTAKLRPTINLNAAQQAALNNGQFASWSVYELMPLDSHTPFASSSKPIEGAIFGDMVADDIAKLLGIPKEILEKPLSELTLQESVLANTLRSYVNDGKRPPEGTPPEQTWFRIRFLQEHKVEVDSAETRIATEGGYFDDSGRTVDSRLKRAADQATVTFKAGDVAVFQRDEADQLIKNKIAELVEPVFIRTLNDYAFAFKDLQLRINKAEQDIETVKREIERTQQTEALGQQQIVAKQAERKLLSDDLTLVQKEAEVARAEVATLEQQLTDLKKELSGMYAASQLLYKRLVETQQAAAVGVN